MGRNKGDKDKAPRKEYKKQSNVQELLLWLQMKPNGTYFEYMEYCFEGLGKKDSFVNVKTFHKERKKLKDNEAIF
jgi:hypothetical protein